MYRYLDRRIVSLNTRERSLVWAVRAWRGARRRGACPVDALAPELVAHGLLPALAPFAAVMAVLEDHARQPIAFAPDTCRRVADGEALLLELVFGFAARSPADTAGAALLVAGDARAPALHEQLARLAAAFDTAVVPRRTPRAPGRGDESVIGGG